MTLGPYATFIIAAYVAALVIVAALILWVVLERRHLARALGEIEMQGLTRRSRSQPEPTS